MSTLFLPQELIRKKRDGLALTDAEISFMVKGITSGHLSDMQLGAFAMAVYQNGMTMAERITLTLQMMHSGKVLSWQQMDLNGPVVDKHSTGGVGDKVSLMLGPIVAAAGAYVPMISGRGLGHTGGTLDKFDSIPGYNAYPSESQFKTLVKNVGCAIIGQTGQLAPADQRLYATRDVTATIESIDLITSSILSKKLAAGLDALVMDVKTGSGAFAKQMSMAQALSQSISHVASGAGVPTISLITDMNQVLGTSVGNATEMAEGIDFLLNPNRADARLLELTLELAAHMIHITGLADNIRAAKHKVTDVLISGKAAEVFAKMVVGLGGPTDLLEKPAQYLPQAAIVKPIFAHQTGYVTAMDVRAIGMCMVSLKAGRSNASDKIDYAVGISQMVQLNDYVEQGQTMVAMAHVQTRQQWQMLNEKLSQLLIIEDKKGPPQALVKEVFQAQ